MEGKRPAWVAAAFGALCLGGCATTTVNFDQLPNGTPVVSQSQPVLQGNAVNPQSIISTQYASEGLEFTSGGPGVFAASFSPSAPSAPNAACPTGANTTANFSATTKIKVSASNICNAWVTITSTSGPTTMKVFDVSGNQIGPTVSSHGSAPSLPGAQETLHINACDIHEIQLSGVNYCFDDVSIRR